MITFTKEQLIASAHARIEFAEMMLAGELEPLTERTLSIELELSRRALASLEAPVLQCPFPCGWENLNKYAIQDAAFVARSLVEGEMVTEAHRHAVFANNERLLKVIAAMLQGADGKPELTVWYGSIPETNGKTNWTAILHRKGQQLWEGITIDRSEYPDRVRYEADRMRHLIGELADEPDILAYDADAHSGYVKPNNSPVIPDWQAQAEKMAESHGSSFVVFRNGESPQCADPTKVIISFTDEGLGHGAAAPQQEVK